jgi:hypothetical protein
MNKKVKTLILMAVNQCGRDSIANVLSVIEEKLTIKEASDTKAFLQWAFFDWDKRSFGHGNIDERISEWKIYANKVKPAKTYKTKSKVLDQNFSRKDNKPMTLYDLIGVVSLINRDPTIERSLFEKPVIVASEGNDMLNLWSIDVSKTGQVTLWPAHI